MKNGNTSTMTYDGNGNMTSVSDAKGNITAMKYGGFHKHLEQTVDALKDHLRIRFTGQQHKKMTDASAMRIVMCI